MAQKRQNPNHKNKITKKIPLWVIKIGSQQVIDGGPLLIRSLMNEVAELVKNKKVKIVWVSSGAIATARKRLNFQWKTLQEKQALSAIGQPLLMDLYNVGLQNQGLMAAQVLLSYNDFRRQESRKNLKNTIFQLLEWNKIPILNENDAVATEEIQFGDNDQLSAKVACELKADRLIILTHIGGLYDKHPDEADAKIISFLPEVSNTLIKKVSQNGKSQVGTGGMQSKLLAAKLAWQQKIPTSIVSGEEPHLLTQLLKGMPCGTTIGKSFQ